MEFQKGHIPWNKGMKKEEFLKYYKNGRTWPMGKKYFIKNIPKEFLYQKYIIEKKSAREIAKELKVARETILKRLHFYKIPLRTCSENSKMNYSKIKQRLFKNLNTKTRRINSKKLWQNKEYREKVSKTWFRKGHKFSRKIREKMIKNILEANRKKPNKKEQLLNQILQAHFPNQFVYSGDGKVVFPCGCPDFWNVNGQKKAILFHGIYWHLWKLQKQNPNLTKEIVEQKDISKYKKYGIDILIIWEDELKNEELILNKINDFMEQKILEQKMTKL